MNKFIVGAIAGFALAGTATASPFGVPGWLDGSGSQTLSHASLQAHSIETGELVYGSGAGFTLGMTEVVTYASGIWPDNNGPFTGAFTGSVLRDDYAKEPGTDGTAVMTRFRFVGGVANAGEQLSFFFLDDDENVIDSFNVTLPQGGNFIWTINLVDGDGNPLGFEKADSGFVQIQHAAEGDFTWFATDALHLGSNMWDPDNVDGTWQNTMYSFSFTNLVPAPGALALLGLAGLVGVGRRRRA